MDPALQIELAALSRQKQVNEGIQDGDSDIQKFYLNSTVFLTGGTGFLGKHMIEKVFRSCNIMKMYLLLRSKKGKTTRERLEEMLADPVFDYLKTVKPDFSSKIVCVEGDVAEIKLGLQDRDWQTLADEVEVIFHCAATTRFDERLRLATLVNVRGTREVLLLAAQANNLKSVVHVSTAYSHATPTLVDQQVQESFYPSPMPPETLISMAENMDPCKLDDITTELIKNWANTYTFTKAVAEEAIRGLSEGIPICILRPGIVVAAHYEPAPGWIDKSAVYSASGMLLGVGLGVLHVILNDHAKRVGLVPCDYVTNAAIVAGRETASLQRKGGNDTPIYTVCSAARNPVTWGDMSKTMKNDCPRIASPSSIYYAYGLETNNMMLYSFLSLFLHVIPAYILDFICFFIGRERMFIKLSKKVKKMTESMSFFCLNQWTFMDGNLEKLYKNLGTKDKLIFNFDITDINWRDYLLVWCIGMRKYIVKDGLNSTDYGVKKQFWFRILHYIFTSFYMFFLWKFGVFVYCFCSNVTGYLKFVN